MLSNFIRNKGGGHSNPNEFGIPSFNRNLDVESSLLWIDNIDKLFDTEYILLKDNVKFVTYKSKGRATT